MVIHTNKTYIYNNNIFICSNSACTTFLILSSSGVLSDSVSDITTISGSGVVGTLLLYADNTSTSSSLQVTSPLAIEINSLIEYPVSRSARL